MSDGTLATAFVPALAMLLAGTVLGFGYFRALHWTAQLYGRGHFIGPAVLTLARLVGAAFFLGFAARLGALPALVAFLGFLLARALAMRAVPTVD